MNTKKLITLLISSAICTQCIAFAEEIGKNLTVGSYPESAAETQKLMDSRPNIQRPMEKLSRGAVAVDMDGYRYISWRWLGTESADTKFNIYTPLGKINTEPLNSTNYIDISPETPSSYTIVPVFDGKEQTDKSETVSVWEHNYIDIPVQTPPENEIKGEKYTYSMSDASVGDLDGDGEYEIVLKWDPSNAKDAAQSGYTGECIIDAYKTDGTRLWRINLGKNIRSGAHDTQFMVYDFDLDGKAEVAMRTADGTVAGDGTVIGDGEKDWTDESGKNLTGPLYLTVFNGIDGSITDTTDYDPQTKGDGWDLTSWGDSWGNRSERYLAAVGYLDGKRPSMIFCRGYYTGPEGDTGGRTVIASFNLENGKIVKDWTFDTMNYNNKYIGQGNHSMSVADVDYDGADEIIYGSLAVDNDGKPMYSTQLGHGDAQHVGDLIPSRPGLEVFSCHEDKNVKYSYDMRDARTGEILWAGEQKGIDNGRAASDDIDPDYPGAESWSAAGDLVAADGTVISNSYTMAANFFAWWDGDLGREIQDNIYISKWNSKENKTDTIFTASGCNSINGTKATPCLTADLFGDWREEVMYPVKDGSALRIYTSTTPTGYRIPTLMHDIQYRIHVALQNTCYNQPTHTSYYLGYDTKTVPVPQIYVLDKDTEIKNPDLNNKKSWNIEDLYTGQRVQLVTGRCTALINGKPVRTDNESTEIVPYVDENSRTLVPLRFIAESLGTDVEWREYAGEIKINGGFITMQTGSTEYTVNGKTEQFDTIPIIKDGRTLVPLRFIAEALGRNVYWNDGLVTVSDIELKITDEQAKALKESIISAPIPKKVEKAALNASGEKYYSNQLDVYNVSASGNDGNLEVGAVDLDMNTRWSAFGKNTLTLDLGSEQEVSGVAIAMWKGAERIYPFSIEVSSDGKTWTEALAKTQNSKTSDDFEKYMFQNPVKAQYVRYSGDGATDPDKNYCHISEIAVLGSEK